MTSSPMDDATRRTYSTLDGMRGLAALAVVTHHAGWMFGPAHMQHAYMAVDLFFILSGFVLAHAYQRRFETGMGAFAFMKLRLIRLYPLYIVGIAISAGWIALNLWQGAPVRLAQAEPWRWDQLGSPLLRSLFFLPGPVVGAGPPALYPLNIPAWSLLFELTVNLGFVLSWRWMTTRALALFCAAAAALLVWMGLKHGHLNTGWAFYGWELALVRVNFGFFAGVLLYRLSSRMPARLMAPPPILLAVMVAAFVWTPQGTALAGFDLFCALVLFPLLVGLGAKVEPRPRSRPAYSFGGVTSYGVYAIHYPLCFVATVGFAVLGHDSAANAPWSGAIFIAGLLALTWLLDRFYDAPLRAWLSRGLRRRHVAAEAAT